MVVVGTGTYELQCLCFFGYSLYLQQSLESRQPGATVLPVIISLDKTQLTLFQSKSTYPIYLTISNILKAIHSKPTQQVQLLMGYILTTQLKNIKNMTAWCQVLANLFHSCMCRVLLPLASYGETGIVMATGDGIWYHCHPILAIFIGDYPKQSLIACTSNGRCPDAPSAWCHVRKLEGDQNILYTTLGMLFIYFLCQTIIQQLSMPHVMTLASNLPTIHSGSISHLPIYFF